MRIKYLFFFIFGVFINAYSSDLEFFSVNSEYGISLRETGTICKDKNGFIWTASKTGILRVSEGDYHIYQLPYKTAEVIIVKLVYGNSKLYAYTNNGQFFVYDELLDRFNFVSDLKSELKNNLLFINEIKVFDDNTFLIATLSGLYLYKNNTHSMISTVECKSIAAIDSTHLFFAKRNELVVIDMATLKSKTVYQSSVLSNMNISKLFYDPQRKILWVGTLSDGLYFYNFGKKSFTKVSFTNFPNQPILAITSNSDSTVLVGIDGQGIWEMNREGTKVLNIYKENVDNPHSLRGDGVYDIFCEDNKRVWISTYSNGLSYFDQKSTRINSITHQINVPNSLCNNNVNKLLEDKRGNIWFATNNGISHWNRTSNKWTTFYQNKREQAQVFLALAEDDNGNIWTGTYSSGVYVLDGATGRELMHFAYDREKKKFFGNFIFDLYKDSDGDMWIGGVQSNLICYEMKTHKFRLYPTQTIKAFDELSKGKILLACSFGLLLLDKQKGTYDLLLQGYITQDIFVQGDDIWVATSGNGLLKYNYKTKTTTKITTESGLPSNYVNSIIYSDGFIWLGTENGLCRFKPTPGKRYNINTISLFSNTSFNAGAKYKLRNGDLIFGSANGAAIFNPDKLDETPFDGHIFIQDIKISGRSIREIPNFELDSSLDKQKEIVLNHNQNTLDLELLPIGVSSNGVKFSWIMQGLDNTWTTASNRRIITYTNIPSGYFKLRIRMYDNSLSHIVDERVLVIHLIPPYWETWWFRFLLFCIFCTIAYFILKYYMNRLNQLHSEDKIRFFTTTAHDIRTSLTLIQAPIEELNKERNISEKGRYYLNLATEQSGKLSFVATQLLDFEKVDVGKGQLFLVMVDMIKLVRQRISMFETAAVKKNVYFVITTNTDSYISAVDELKIEKVIDNLISNAIKYSYSNKAIEISMQCDENFWSLSVKDYGLGISENAQKKLFREFYRGDNVVNSKMIGSGIGLLLVKNYVDLHSGVVTLVSKENEGSTFRIRIPYKHVNEIAIQNQLFEVEQSHSNEHLIDSSNLEDEVKISDKKIHVLVVEDNNDLQNFIKSAFEPTYKVTTANNGKEAWGFIQKKLPDLVVSDILMPEMDGFDLCELIKSTFDTSHIPVILLTSLCERKMQLEGLRLGADDYITKPFDIDLLKQKITTIIKNRDVVREKALKFIRQPESDQPILTNEHNDHFVRKALVVVRENIANCDFGKDEFASAMNASSSLLYKKIKTLTGQSPVDFIKIIRLDYSLELLQSRKYTVTEVSEMCGFASIGYFSTVFKKHFGKSPTEINE